MKSCSVIFPLYVRTLELFNKDVLSIEDKNELYSILKYIDQIYENNKHVPYIHNTIQLICSALR